MIRLPLEPASLDLVQDDIERSRDFFGHGEIVIDYDARLPDLEEIRALHEVLRERGIRLRAVIAENDDHREMLRSWGFMQPRTRRRRLAHGEPSG